MIDWWKRVDGSELLFLRCVFLFWGPVFLPAFAERKEVLVVPWHMFSDACTAAASRGKPALFHFPGGRWWTWGASHSGLSLLLVQLGASVLCLHHYEMEFAKRFKGVHQPCYMSEWPISVSFSCWPRIVRTVLESCWVCSDRETAVELNRIPLGKFNGDGECSHTAW